jgi:demethylmenaquinone methyltransferase/2-methoxy-6-polyprenyl-1,4-benzoquinol methylase
MFARVAPRYDLLNHLLSFDIDRAWRRALREAVAPDLQKPGSRGLDLCCGTGDVLLDLQRIEGASMMGADFCHPMLVRAAQKTRTPLIEADALQMPLRSDSVDVITIAFGFRNLANYANGLAELHRILKSGGKLAILEFSHPKSALVRAGYGFYSRFILPNVGRLISGSADAYAYLPESIRRFPRANELAEMMNRAGFEDTHFRLLSGGIAALHTGRKR